MDLDYYYRSNHWSSHRHFNSGKSEDAVGGAMAGGCLAASCLGRLAIAAITIIAILWLFNLLFG